MSALRVASAVALGSRTTYRVGGTVAHEVVVDAASLDELAATLESLSSPSIAVGLGSNLLVGDGHHDLTIVRVAVPAGADDLSWRDGEAGVAVEVGAGLGLPVVARRLAAEGIVNFEWAVGIPGSIGGAIAMNAGGHGSSMDAVVSAVQVWRAGTLTWRAAPELAFGYRSSAIEAGDVVVRVRLALARGDAPAARSRVREIVQWRRENQPGGANAGSVFQNPAGDHAGRLLDAAGCKGLRHGGATVSAKHANFILAEPDGCARDVLALMREMRRRVAAEFGVVLRTEHRLIGVGEDEWPAEPAA